MANEKKKGTGAGCLGLIIIVFLLVLMALWATSEPIEDNGSPQSGTTSNSLMQEQINDYKPQSVICAYRNLKAALGVRENALFSNLEIKDLSPDKYEVTGTFSDPVMGTKNYRCEATFDGSGPLCENISCSII